MDNKNVQILTEISVSKARLIDSLIEGKSISKAAELAVISRQTVYNWKKDPEFINILRVRFAEEEESRAAKRAERLNAAWAIVDRAARGDLIPEEKISLAAAQFTIRTLEKTSSETKIENVIHRLDRFERSREN
jgi:transposase